MYVCICHDIKSKQIKKAIKDGYNTIDALKNELAVATCCGCCEPMVQDYLDEYQASSNDKTEPASAIEIFNPFTSSIAL